jgi:hypothetical protein
MDTFVETTLHYAREHVFLTISSAFVTFSIISWVVSWWNAVNSL